MIRILSVSRSDREAKGDEGGVERDRGRGSSIEDICSMEWPPPTWRAVRSTRPACALSRDNIRRLRLAYPLRLRLLN
jgi:hypothetical protein